ncbi:MAG TPA: hypothetical protein PKN33_21240 [Phycisphaerae bacterium]|nr:hypothetical protein [Phycisphaerae bacterium]
MKLIPKKEERPFEFGWWSGNNEPYEVCWQYEIVQAPTGLAAGDIFVAVGWREAYGANRRRILVFRDKQHVLVEFVGADDWRNTGHVVWPLKEPGGHHGVTDFSDVSEDLKGYEIDSFKEWVTGPSARSGLAVRLRETNHVSMIHIALIRERDKKRQSNNKDLVKMPQESEDDQNSNAVAHRQPRPEPRKSKLPLRDRLASWLEGHDSQIDRFRKPVLLANVAKEIGASIEDVRQFLATTSEPIYHIWSHEYRGKISRSKPYCLRLNGPDSVGLDWEHSVVGAMEDVFRKKGFETCQELGTDNDIERLISDVSLGGLSPGVNQRDLWALWQDQDAVDLWIIEAKGKEAAEFEHYCFAEVLSQVFEVPAEPLTDLLGARRKAGHGLCWKFASRISDAWLQRGLTVTVTVAILLPAWAPDIVWKSGLDCHIQKPYYGRALESFNRFLSSGETDAHRGKFKYERAFGEVLEHLQSEYEIRQLATAETGLRFRMLTTGSDPATGQFELSGLNLLGERG